MTDPWLNETLCDSTSLLVLGSWVLVPSSRVVGFSDAFSNALMHDAIDKRKPFEAPTTRAVQNFPMTVTYTNWLPL